MGLFYIPIRGLQGVPTTMTINDLVNMIHRSQQCRYLYHFTDESNLPSIAMRGILSKVQIKKERLSWPDASGGNLLSRDLDAQPGS